MNASWLLLTVFLNTGIDQMSPQISAQPPIPRAIAEFEPADAVVIAWDMAITSVLTDIISAVPQETPIYVVFSDDADLEEIAEALVEPDVLSANILFIREALDSPWIRDFGPITVETRPGAYAFVDTRYWETRLLDDEIPAILATRFGLPLVRSDLAMDGGNFLANGRGFCIVSTRLLEENPELTEEELADAMSRCFGCNTLAILEPLIGEDTGHVDVFAKFIDGETLLIGAYEKKTDPENAAVLDENVTLLRQAAAAADLRMKIHRMPMGSHHDGNFRTYLNALLVNDVLIVPVYADEPDQTLEQRALEVYRNVMPAEIAIKTVDVTGLNDLGGAVHCLTLNLNHIPKTSTDTPPIAEKSPTPKSQRRVNVRRSFGL